MGLYKAINDKLRNKMEGHPERTSRPVRRDPVSECLAQLKEQDGNLHVLMISSRGNGETLHGRASSLRPQVNATEKVNTVLYKMRDKGYSIKGVHSTPLLVGDTTDGVSDYIVRFYTEIQYQ